VKVRNSAVESHSLTRSLALGIYLEKSRTIENEDYPGAATGGIWKGMIIYGYRPAFRKENKGDPKSFGTYAGSAFGEISSE